LLAADADMEKKFEFRYNTGAITRCPFEGEFGSVHDFVWRMRQVLSPDAVLFLGWAESRPPSWVPRVDDVKATFGWDDKQWRRIRRELERIGCVTSTRTRAPDSSKSHHRLDVDVEKLAVLAPPARNGGSRARPAISAVSRDPAKKGESLDPPKMAGLTTTIETRLINHDQAGGVDKSGMARCALVAPTGAVAVGQRLGELLGDLLDVAQARRVDKAATGATDAQILAAAAAARAAVASGKAKSAVRYAMHMAKMASLGQIETTCAPAAPAPQERGVAAEADTDESAEVWLQRTQKVGWSVTHQRGKLVLADGARAWRHVGGQHHGCVVVGADALSVWRGVIAGELTLTPPCPA
jgi:hypothetical protein